MAKRSDNPPEDQRARALGKVWGSALVMLAICIPLCYILKSAVLPLAVIISAAVVTFYVWNSSELSGSENSENEALRAKVKELEERLANVEVINRFEEHLAEEKLARDAEMPPVEGAASEKS